MSKGESQPGEPRTLLDWELFHRRRCRHLTGWEGQVWTREGWKTVVRGTQADMLGWERMTQTSMVTLWTEPVQVGNQTKAVFRMVDGPPRIRILDPLGYDVGPLNG